MDLPQAARSRSWAAALAVELAPAPGRQAAANEYRRPADRRRRHKCLLQLAAREPGRAAERPTCRPLNGGGRRRPIIMSII